MANRPRHDRVYACPHRGAPYKVQIDLPDKPFTPKVHYMVHYPAQILNYGPLICSWTMSHEAKLSVKEGCKAW